MSSARENLRHERGARAVGTNDDGVVIDLSELASVEVNRRASERCERW